VLVVAAAVAAVAIAPAAGSAAQGTGGDAREHAAAPAPAGRWTLMRARPAPWAATSMTPQRDAAIARLSGAGVVFHADRVDGPAPLACANARYRFTAVAPAGLFQGSLPQPAGSAAARLGLADRTPTLRIECDSGVFDLHLVEPVRALFALDDLVWTLRHDGPPDTSALAAAQRLMLTHFAHDMAFTPGQHRTQAPLAEPGTLARDPGVATAPGTGRRGARDQRRSVHRHAGVPGLVPGRATSSGWPHHGRSGLLRRPGRDAAR
jgi:hypothetical protein